MLAFVAFVASSSVEVDGADSEAVGFVDAFVETESVESLQAAAAALQQQAAEQAALENQQLDDKLHEQLKQLAQNPDAALTPSEHELISHAAHAPQDADTDRMTSVVSLDQFEDEVHPALLDEASTNVDFRIAREIEAQVTQHTLDEIRRDAHEAAQIQEYLRQQAGESIEENDLPFDSLLESSQSTESDMSMMDAHEREAMQSMQAAAEEAKAISENYEMQQDYPVMIESASQSRSTAGAQAENVPEMVKSAWNSARKGLSHAASGASGMMGKLKSHIKSALSRSKYAREEEVAQSKAHSFLASKARVYNRAKAKEGGQWWLEKAPWFLPPPPEWGPMPVTMYTSYYHKPVHPHHLDYAHGIPLPHAEALNLARRTYPQPPFEQSAGGEASFMEVGSTSTSTAELDEESLNEIAALAEQEDAFQAEEEPILMELHSAAEQHLANEGESESESESASDSFAESESSSFRIDPHPTFILDPSSQQLSSHHSEAVEAVEVDNLAAASPIPAEEFLSVPM